MTTYRKLALMKASRHGLVVVRPLAFISWKIGVSPSESRIQMAMATRSSEMMKGRRQSHAGQRDDEGVLAADLVAEPTEHERAQRTDEEADGKNRDRAQECRDRMPLLEELDREDRGEAAEDVKVVPLDDVAHGCGDDDAAQFAERDFGSPHWLPLQSRIAAVMGQPPQLWWWCTPAKSRDVGSCYTV